MPEPEPVEFAIWPENVDTVQMFIDVQTQWRVGGAGVIGLDYGVVMSLANLKAVADPLGLLRDLQVMELRARELINAEAAPK